MGIELFDKAEYWAVTRIKNPFAEQVEPNEARRGTFLKSFPLSEELELLKFCRATVLAMDYKGIRGKLVFTEIRITFKVRTWQVFVISEELQDGRELWLGVFSALPALSAIGRLDWR